MMVELALIAVAGVLYWAWKTRDAQAMRISDVMAAIAVLIGLKLFKSNIVMALFAFGAAAWWIWFRRKAGGGDAAMTHAEARRLLEVPVGASSDEIRAAHRRLVARVHPDVGGSADLTRQVNTARDTLLRHRS